VSADFGRGLSSEHARRAADPSWEFREARVERRDLGEPVPVARGAESIGVTRTVEVLLTGRLDPGAAEWYDSYLPTLRVGGRESSRMTEDSNGVRFTYYPDIDGDIEGGAVEFRARLDEEFEGTGLEI
jgi:hypothetical protein